MTEVRRYSIANLSVSARPALSGKKGLTGDFQTDPPLPAIQALTEA